MSVIYVGICSSRTACKTHDEWAKCKEAGGDCQIPDCCGKWDEAHERAENSRIMRFSIQLKQKRRSHCPLQIQNVLAIIFYRIARTNMIHL